MRTELANWTARQSKHAAVAYPLITNLICLEENNTFSQYVDTLVDNLHRQLKACKLNLCIARLAKASVHLQHLTWPIKLTMLFSKR